MYNWLKSLLDELTTSYSWECAGPPIHRAGVSVVPFGRRDPSRETSHKDMSYDLISNIIYVCDIIYIYLILNIILYT